MKIDVVFEAQLREIAGQHQVSLSLNDNQTVAEVLQHVSAGSLGLQERLLNSNGGLQSGIMVFINDQPVTAADVPHRKLQDGDFMLLLPPISGG